MRLLKLAVRIIVWPLMLVAVLYLLLLAINAKDRPPSADAQRLDSMVRNRAPVADADNGRLYLQRWTRLRKADPAYQGKDAPFIAALKNDCRTVDRACLALLEANDKPIRETLAAQAVTLAHYRELIALTGWQAPFPLDMTNLPDAVAAGDGQRLLLLAAWLRARDGDANAVSAALAAEHRFWRMALGSTDELISKMFALAYLQRNLAWGNMVLGQLPPKAQRAAVPAPWRLPVTARERSLLLPLVGEYQFIKQMTEDIASGNASASDPLPPVTRVLGEPLFQRQDSRNKWAALALADSAAFDVDYRDIAAGMAAAKARAGMFSGSWSLDDLYNPMGAVLLKVSAGQWSTYAARLADLEGARRAAVLTVELRSAGAAADQLAERLAAAELRNPYDDKPFGWDAGERSITFTGLATGERGRSRFVY